jgi:uncharacterized membrane protein
MKCLVHQNVNQNILQLFLNTHKKFQVLQVCETGDAHGDVSGRHFVDKYRSFCRTCCLHYMCRIFQRLILILKMINFATYSWWLLRDFSGFAIFKEMLIHKYLCRAICPCTTIDIGLFSAWPLSTSPTLWLQLLLEYLKFTIKANENVVDFNV